MKTRYLLFALLIIGSLDCAAQYRRRGETLQNPRNQKTPATAKPSANINQQFLIGKWQEMKRLDRTNNTPQSFTDTMYLHFIDNKKMQLKEGIGTRIASDYYIDGEELIVSVQAFVIKSLTQDQLILDEGDDWVKEFVKVPSFFHESFGKNPIKTDIYNEAIAPDLNKWAGSWFVYRRQAKPGALSANDYVIKSLNVKSVANNVANIDLVYYNRDTTISASGKLTSLEKSILIEVPGFTQELNVLGQNGSELVFGRTDALVYYCRPTKN